jgi:hypothetical protein
VSDAENLSKRERQKQRLQAKREQQQAEAKKARARRLVTFVVIGALVAAGIGLAVQRQVAQRAEQRAMAQRAQEALADLGCTEITEMPNLGQGHLQGTAEALAANPPDLLYPDRPATSGQHMDGVVNTGVYDTLIDERLLVHNLEHGYVLFWYDQDADEAQVERLRTWAQERIDGDFQKIIVAPWIGDALPDDAQFATVAWTARQLCRDFDEEVAQVFLNEWHGNAGDAPEKFVPPHMSGQADPSESDILFPPLDTEIGDGTSAPLPEPMPTDREGGDAGGGGDADAPEETPAG